MGNGEMGWIGAMPAGSMTEPYSIPSPNPESPAEVRATQLD